MSTTADPKKDYAGHQFVITRYFDAPRTLVFQAWTQPHHIMHWWGPRGFTNPVVEWKAKPGEKIHVVMHAPNGTDYPMGGEFREVDEPNRLVLTTGALDEQGKLLFELLHTVTFEEQNGKTKLTIQSEVIKTSPRAGQYIGGFEPGMTQSLDKLAELVAVNPEPFVIERTFNAPVGLVWKAISNKDDMKRWYFDLAAFKPEKGFEFGFVVEYAGTTFDHRCRVLEAVPNQKLVYTWRYDGQPGESVVTFELFPEGDQTRLKLTHAGLETFPRKPAYARANFMMGWTSLIGTELKTFLEGGLLEPNDRELFFVRIINAPRDLVWQAFTDPKHAVRWWGPKGFTNTSHEMDVRPGGRWRFTMHGPDGTDYPNRIEYVEVVKPERLDYHHGDDKDPQKFHVTTKFTDLGGRTRIENRMVFRTAAECAETKKFAVAGYHSHMQCLEEHLATMDR